MIKAEKEIIMLMKDRNLPYHSCINQNNGGGWTSEKRLEPLGLLFGVYLSYSQKGIEPFILNTRRILNYFGQPLRILERALATSSSYINLAHNVSLLTLKDSL